jgi:hypothetical protein
MTRLLTLATVAAVGLLSSCGSPDLKALQKIACEQAAASIDLQSIAQMDALRKALGVAPDVDPINYCRSLGAVMEPQVKQDPQQSPEGANEGSSESN